MVENAIQQHDDGGRGAEDGVGKSVKPVEYCPSIMDWVCNSSHNVQFDSVDILISNNGKYRFVISLSFVCRCVVVAYPGGVD